MDHNETGCQAPERPILCVNNCGFFGSSTTMNMCSKCHKEAILKEDREKLAASSIDNLVNGTSNNNKDSIVKAEVLETKAVNEELSCDSSPVGPTESKKGPSRCTTCQKRVGLTGFSCRCGNLFCSAHRYSDKHECSFDYRGVAQSSIAKANPVIKAAKLDKF
ncbi:zinc finger A20 and AN1 domain-containing stress-associated protein 8-like [Silene latifolia]|uniref:zinc finger A20 and AN1 domain-containing stress-associated protein 8-like n=1 Tax=Silene latifolia TaxID=37657 RepID=UPI003D78A90D